MKGKDNRQQSSDRDASDLERGINILVTANSVLQMPLASGPVGVAGPPPALDAEFPGEWNFPPENPEVVTSFAHGGLRVTIKGDARRRQVVALSLSTEPWLEGEEDDGPVERFTRPIGSDALAVFPLARGVSGDEGPPAVHLDWEDAEQIADFSPGNDDTDAEIRIQHWSRGTPIDFDEEAYHDELLAEKGCEREDAS